MSDIYTLFQLARRLRNVLGQLAKKCRADYYLSPTGSRQGIVLSPRAADDASAIGRTAGLRGFGRIGAALSSFVPVSGLNASSRSRESVIVPNSPPASTFLSPAKSTAARRQKQMHPNHAPDV